MLGARTLLVNPPLVNGVAFTRQGRCQEREEVLGTTKPPYSLVVIATLLRQRGVDFRLVDLTAEAVTTEDLIARLRREGFAPTLILFCSTTPTLDADVAEMTKLKREFGASIFCFGPHASAAPQASMARAPEVDGMLVGEPEDAAVALVTAPSRDALDGISSLAWRRGAAIVPHTARGVYADFVNMPALAWDLLPLERYRLPMADKPYVLVETSRGCPYSCDFCVVPLHHGHKFRERAPSVVVDEIERLHREQGIEYFYLWADTVTLNVKTFSAFCEELIARDLPIQWFGNARADNLIDPAFVARLKRSGCWMLAMGVESASDDIRKDMLKRLEKQKIQTAFANLRQAGIKSFAFFILGYPGDTRASMDETARYAVALDPDFANFYPAVPYPGTELYEKARREGLLIAEDWSRMEYSYYLMAGGELNPDVVMQAIARARRRFFMRPRYIARHLGDGLRLAASKPSLVLNMAARLVLGSGRTDLPAGPAPARVHDTSAA